LQSIHYPDTLEFEDKIPLKFLDAESPHLEISNFESFPDWICRSIELLHEMEELILWEQLWFDLAEANVSTNGFKIPNCGIFPGWITSRYHESIRLLDEMEEMFLWEQLWFDLDDANVSINGFKISNHGIFLDGFV
jgi:hypothetical protein